MTPPRLNDHSASSLRADLNERHPPFKPVDNLVDKLAHEITPFPPHARLQQTLFKARQMRGHFSNMVVRLIHVNYRSPKGERLPTSTSAD